MAEQIKDQTSLVFGQTSLIFGQTSLADLFSLPDNIIFYDNFGGAVTPLSGQLPVKGPAWGVTGEAAADVVAGGGVMYQDGPEGKASYSFINNAARPIKIVGDWMLTAVDGVGEVKPPLTLAVCKDGSFIPMLHGEGGPNFFYIRLIDTGVVYKDPLFVLNKPNFILDPGTWYRTELHHNNLDMAAMRLRNTAGDIIGEQFVYDFRLADYLGDTTFWEALTNRQRVSLAYVDTISDYIWPNITFVGGVELPTTSEFTATVFGGTGTSESNGLRIAGDTWGQGQQFNIGAITAGEEITYTFDVLDLTAGYPEIALLKTGVFEAEKSNVIYFNATGRQTGRLVATETMANASFAIARSNHTYGTAGNWLIANFQLIKNAPTSI